MGKINSRDLVISKLKIGDITQFGKITEFGRYNVICEGYKHITYYNFINWSWIKGEKDECEIE